MEAALQQAMDEIMVANPEMSFWEVCAELVKKGDLNFEATENANVHTWLYGLFQRSKIKANASKHKAMSYGRMRDKQKQLRDEVTQLLAQAEAADAAEDAEYGADRRGDELPAELQRRESRLKRIREAKRALDRNIQRDKEVLHQEMVWQRAAGVPSYVRKAEHDTAHRELADAHHAGHAALEAAHREGHFDLGW